MTRTREILTAGTILQNRYRVLRELGHGGMGTVYEALDQRINCLVALKETSAGNENEARRAFEREASLLGNLRHSGLPKVMDYFSEGDADFLIMEFIPGHDLANLLESRGTPFPQDQVLFWADEILKVLEYLHGQEPPILHRDIKPANLKLTTRGEIFLLDFGLAKGTAGQMQTLATSRSVYGYTPVYASLEQILGQGTDPRSDLYSVGATLYHLLTSVVPADAPKRFSLIEDEQPDPLQPIEKINAECTPSVAAIIHQAMAINRRQRPGSAGEMRLVLRAAAEKDATEAEVAARAAEERKRRQFAGTFKLDEGFQEEVERVRREEEASRRLEAERQAEAQRAAEAERLRLAEAQRAEAAERQAEAAQRIEQERLRATEEARRIVEAERRRLEAERQTLEEAERRAQQAEAERLRVAAEQRQREAETIAETTILSPAPAVSAQPLAPASAASVARPPIRSKTPMLIAIVVLFAAVAAAAAVVVLHPWGGGPAAGVSNSNNANVPADNSNGAVPADNSNQSVVPSHGQTGTTPAKTLNSNTTAGTSVKPENTNSVQPENTNRGKPENTNRTAAANVNKQKPAQTSNLPNINGKKRVDDAAERRRRARSILDRP